MRHKRNSGRSPKKLYLLIYNLTLMMSKSQTIDTYVLLHLQLYGCVKGPFWSNKKHRYASYDLHIFLFLLRLSKLTQTILHIFKDGFQKRGQRAENNIRLNHDLFFLDKNEDCTRRGGNTERRPSGKTVNFATFFQIFYYIAGNVHVCVKFKPLCQIFFVKYVKAFLHYTCI